jgi:hypothetical protein
LQELEIYSIDEAFLGMGGCGRRLEGQARALRAAAPIRSGGSPGAAGLPSP